MLSMLHDSVPSAGAAGPATAAAAASMISTTASSSSSSVGKGTSSSNTPAASWLLLLGRCCLQWAAELAQKQAVGADWVQLIRLAQQQQQSAAVGGEVPAVITLPFCFAGSRPQLLSLSECVITTQGGQQHQCRAHSSRV
jgi:hypothetical protein